MNNLNDAKAWLENLGANISDAVDCEVFMNVAAAAFVKEPKLFSCTVDSIITALNVCSYRGLLPDGKEAIISPKGVNVGTKQQPKWENRANYQAMVDGVLKMARKSPDVLSIAAHPVYTNDQFDYWVDEHGEHFNHRPVFGNRGKFALVYAFAKLANGELLVEVMDFGEVEKTREASKMSKSGPWKTWYDRMACKGVLHRLARRLPNADEITPAIEQGQSMTWEKGPEEAEAIEYYPDDKFEQNFAAWEKLITDGEYSAFDIIEKSKRKGVIFTEAQQLALTNINQP